MNTEREIYSDSMRDRFLQLPIAERLGDLASELAHVSEMAKIGNVGSKDHIRFCSYLIEWGAPGLLPDRVEEAAELVDVQRRLVNWYWHWDRFKNSFEKRQEIVTQARAWSDEVLKMSGLLDPE